ncbi:MAG: DUF502 domain-containing protein [Oxalobacter sp.]|nr:MAG: DUF502 domain-containing protein [Oxalobacter sp.]
MRKYFVTGLLVLIPLTITAWILSKFIYIVDHSLLLLPASWRPDALLGFHIHGSGLILSVIIVFLTGLLVRNVIGTYLHDLWEALLRKIPFVSSLYFSVKQISDTLFSPSGNAFRQAVLVQYPREGMWSIAFLTGIPDGEVRQHLPDDYVSIYVPTTPNPTSGFFLVLRRAEVIELNMSVDAALKYIISMGVVPPPS